MRVSVAFIVFRCRGRYELAESGHVTIFYYVLFMRVSVVFLVFRCRGRYELAEIPPPHKYRLHNLHILGSYSPPRAVSFKEGNMATFFPKIGSSDENVSPPTTGHQKGQKRSGVSVGKPFFPIFVWTRRLQVLQGMSVRKSFTQTFANLTCLC